MNPAQLHSHFDRISEAPDAIPRLRRFILDLAVRGKLVQQDPNDEPVSIVDIPCSKQSNGRGMRENLGDDTWPNDLPESWRWYRLGAVSQQITDGEHATPPRIVEEEIPLVTAKNVRNGFMDYGYTDWVSFETANRAWIRCRPAVGDVLLVCVGATTGRLCVLRDARDMVLVRSVALIRPNSAVNVNYLALTLRSPMCQAQMWAKVKMTAQPCLYINRIKSLPIPLPPLAEQHCIVAKVDELMALCDQLEAAQAERESRRDRVVAASLHSLNNGADGEAFRNHARFYLNCLPRLTTSLENIQQLRQTILSLAIRGQLVPQGPNDVPVSELLKRIQAEKARLVSDGKLRGNTKITPIEPEEGHFPIPASWVCVQFGEIMISRDGERIPISKEERSQRKKVYDYYGASGVIDKIDGYLFDKPLLLIGEDGANLINRSTPIAFIARGKYWVNNHAHVLDGISEDFLRFIELHINAIDLKPYLTGAAQPKMNQAKMNSIPIALPPHAEQHRIVAKVDELMGLCDRLEAQLTSTQTESHRLLEVVLREALSA